MMTTIATRYRIVPLAVLLFLLSTSLSFAEEASSWPPEFYAFCIRDPSVPNQVQLLKELGYDGAGYGLWLDDKLNENLRILDEADLELCLVYTRINLQPGKPGYDGRVPAALAKLKGRPVTVSVLLSGYSPSDPQGMERAVTILRDLGDLAAKSGLKISIYHHVNNWTESLLFALDVVKNVDRPNVGVNFNLCHWLKVDGDKDYRPVLRGNAERIFAVTINGAQTDAEAWAGGLIQPLDRGDFDNGELLALLKQIGYRGPVGLMCYGIPDDTRDHLQRSMQVWKSWQEQQP